MSAALSPAMLAAGWQTSSPDPRDASPVDVCVGSGQMVMFDGGTIRCPVCLAIVAATLTGPLDHASGPFVNVHAAPDAPPQPGGRDGRPAGPSFGL